MPAAILDLWPPDLFASPAPPTTTPVAILRQQGDALGARTHNFVRCEVETVSSPLGTTFTHKLILVAPFLRYRQPILLVHNGLQPYPASLADTELTKSGAQWSRPTHNEQELRDALREFFNQEQVKEVIRAVNDMSNDIVSSENGVG